MSVMSLESDALCGGTDWGRRRMVYLIMEENRLWHFDTQHNCSRILWEYTIKGLELIYFCELDWVGGTSFTVVSWLPVHVSNITRVFRIRTVIFSEFYNQLKFIQNYLMGRVNEKGIIWPYISIILTIITY